MAKHEEVRPSSVPSTSDYPLIGEATLGLGQHLIAIGKLTDDGSLRLRQDAVEIVRRSRRFGPEDGQQTGLVVGYVQSGKTMSMTAVSAMARDNGCRIVVLLAGVTTNLLDQNAKRFKTDLRAASGPAAWRIINSSGWSSSQPVAKDPDKQHLQQAVAEWRDPAFAETDRQTFLIMVLKNHVHLERLATLLASVDLSHVPALILDDEADQAGLNTRPEEPDASTTYDRIRKVRQALPNHTYLQYTATPQAPLLIALDDMLSPSFAELVRPGDGYTGGLQFFGPHAPNGLVRSIPASDLFKPGEPPTDPPDSLLEALRVFFVGAAIATFRKGPTPRSMLVHPSSRKADHQTYLRWVGAIIKRWTGSLRSTDPLDRQETLDEFRGAYDDLVGASASVPSFESLTQRLQLSLGRVSLKEVNGQDGTEVDWENAEEHILVGGEKLNRGFTVEGLTVTYMPRGTGDWNADTIQQRARFFGYKLKYLDLCRLYLHPDVIHAFRSYVTHEEDIRCQLLAHRGQPLREWRRAFFLNESMRPTRRNVVRDPYYRIPADQVWFLQRHPQEDAEAAAQNRAALRDFEAHLAFEADDSYFRHKVAVVPLHRLQEVLVAYNARGRDRPNWYGQLISLGDVTALYPGANAIVVKMNGERARKLDGDGSIAIHQGASSKAGGYPGDNKMCDPKLVTLQIHTIDVKNGPKDVPAIALHIPRALKREDIGVQVPRE